jgi:hypothetical protein
VKRYKGTCFVVLKVYSCVRRVGQNVTEVLKQDFAFWIFISYSIYCVKKLVIEEFLVLDPMNIKFKKCFFKLLLV